ncbi:hypothetical protein QC760_002611 [Botrytis cinerea]
MAECMLIMHGGQPEDFQMVVAKVLDLIESHFGKQESLLQNCKCLVLASPIQYLESEFSYEPKDVAFVQLFNLTFEKKEGKLTYDHLWRDYIPLLNTKSGEKLIDFRIITLLDHDLNDSGRHYLRYRLCSSVAIRNEELSPPRNNQEVIDTISDSSLSDSINSEKGDDDAPVNNCKLSSDWLIDFDNPHLDIPALEAKECHKFEAAACLGTNRWKSARVIKSKEGAAEFRKAHFNELERDITALVAQLQTWETEVESHALELNTHISTVTTRESEVKERESDIHQRECDTTVWEIAIVQLEKSTRTRITAELKCRFLDAESLEKCIAIRNEALRELEEKLDDRKQLAMVDKKTLREECARVSRHIVKIKIHEDMVKGAEALPISRERAHKKFRDEFQVREALIKEREAAIDPRKDNARQNHFAKFSPTGLFCKAQQFVKAEQAKVNSEVMVRELAVLEREQKMAALEAALNLEREMIRTRFRETEEMKQRTDASQAEVKNQRTALYIEEKKK